jgi:RNA polymerase sigma factor (sigma-70 family)
VSVSLSVDGPGDAELISAVRGGDSDAYGELFARHVDAARRLARQLAGPADADDLVSDAFTKVLTVLQRGGGPDLAFRAYLLTAVRRLHVDRIRAGSRLRPVDDLTPFDPGLPFQDTAVEGFDNAAAARAFASLPERWQMVLWHTEVEQQKPADIAPLLGMSANSVSALAYRAREGLRQAFLSQHASDPDDVDCAWTRDHLGAYVRGGLSRRDAARVDDHLAACRACAAVYLELTEVNSGLAALLAPLLLGSASAAYLSSTGAGAGAAGSGVSAWTAATSWVGGHTAVAAVSGVLITAAASVAVYVGAQMAFDHPATRDADGALGRPPAVASSSPAQDDGPGSSHGPNDGKTQNVVPPVVSQSAPPPSDTAPTDLASSPATESTSEGPDTQPTSDGPGTDPTGSPTGPTDPGGRDVTFTSTPPSNPKFGDTYEVSASTGSGKQVSFTVEPTTNSLGPACEISGSTVTFTHAGTCVVVGETGANRAVNNGGAGARAQQSIDVPRQNQRVAISTDAPTDPAFGTSYTVYASSNSDAPVVLSVDSSRNSLGRACTLTDSTVTFDHAGRCQITAEAGNDDYLPDIDTQTVTVLKKQQTVSIRTNAPTDPAFGQAYTVDASSDSGAPVTLAVDSSRNSLGRACTLIDSTVTFDHAGSCQITAEAGNDDYLPDIDTQTVTVLKQQQTVSISSNAPTTPAFGSTYTVTATSDADVPVDVSIDPSSNRLGPACSLEGTTVTFEHAASCVITAEAGNDDYLPAHDSQTVEVPKAAQVVEITPAAPSTAVVGTSYPFTVTRGQSGNDVEVETSNNDVCTVAGSEVSFVAPGNCVITASQDGTDDYDAAPTVTQSVNVVATPPASDLTVTAEVTGGNKNKTFFRATAHGLPKGTKATIRVTPEGNYALKPVDGNCEKAGPASYECTVTSANPSVNFEVNVQHGRVINFVVAPIDPLIDTKPDNNDFTLTLRD